MSAPMRKTGISVLGDAPWGTHLCHFYEGQLDLLNIVAPYFRAGLEGHEYCLWAVDEPFTPQIAEVALRQAGPIFEKHLAYRDIEVVSARTWYLDGLTFDPDRVVNQWNEKLEMVLAQGYAGLRINGGTSWVERTHWADFLQYEQRIDAFLEGKRMLVLCSYPLGKSAATEIFEVARTHQLAVVKRKGVWEVLETPELKQAKSEIKRLHEQLEHRVEERTRQLAAANEELRLVGDQRRALAARLQVAVEDERSRIARELHDEVGSILTRLKWDVNDIDQTISAVVGPSGPSAAREKVAAVLESIDAAMETVRRISMELRPAVLDELGLMAALQWTAQQFEERTGIVSNFHSLVERSDVGPRQATALFRICEEALTNVLRHAGASRVNIVLERRETDLVLRVTDDGKGITEEARAGAGSLGLLGMRERAHLVGGELAIQGVPGHGTTLTVRVPIL